MSNPPQLLKDVGEVMLVLLDVKYGKKNDSWRETLKLFANTKATINMFVNYDIKKCDAKKYKKLRKMYDSLPGKTVGDYLKVSAAIGGFWVFLGA